MSDNGEIMCKHIQTLDRDSRLNWDFSTFWIGFCYLCWLILYNSEVKIYDAPITCFENKHVVHQFYRKTWRKYNLAQVSYVVHYTRLYIINPLHSNKLYHLVGYNTPWLPRCVWGVLFFFFLRIFGPSIYCLPQKYLELTKYPKMHRYEP